MGNPDRQATWNTRHRTTHKQHGTQDTEQHTNKKHEIEN